MTELNVNIPDQEKEASEIPEQPETINPNKEIEDLRATELITLDQFDWDSSRTFVYKDDVYSWSVLFFEITNLSIWFKLWMFFMVIFSFGSSIYIIRKFMTFIIAQRDRQIQYQDGSDQQIMSPKFTLYNPIDSANFSIIRSNITSFKDFTNQFYNIFNTNIDMERVQNVTQSIASYDQELIIVVMIGSLLVVAKIQQQIIDSFDYFRYAYQKSNYFLKIQLTLLGGSLCFINLAVFWLTMAQLDSITNILDAFIKTCGCLLILQIDESVFIINQQVFQKRLISMVRNKELDHKVEMPNNQFFVFLLIMEKILLIQILIVPIKNFWFKFNAEPSIQLEPSQFQLPFRYSKND